MPRWQRYTICAAAVALATAAHHGFTPFTPFPFLIYLFPVVFAATLFDRGSGYFTTVLSTAVILFEYWTPVDGKETGIAPILVAAGLFVAASMVISAVIETLRGTVEDLAEANETLKQSRRELGQALNILETVIGATPNPIWVKDRDGRFVSVNTAFARMMGLAAKAMIGKTYADLLPAPQAEVIEDNDRTVIETGAAHVFEEEICVTGLGPRFFLATKSPWYGPDGVLCGVIGMASDIHDRKMAEDRVRQADRQKELLLFDLNHRVKNHLQAMVAAIALGRRQMTDAAGRAVADAAISRLSVLARVYDRLQIKAGAETDVDAKEFLEGLCADLRSSVLDRPSIALELDIDTVPLEAGAAVSVGLIVNEALSNALKHAFPDGRPGTIAVVLRATDREVFLEVRDDGVGHRLAASAGVGRRLIEALAQQLGGAVTWQGPPGTTVAVAFPAARQNDTASAA